MEGITISQDLPPRVAPNTPIEMPKFGFGAAPIGDLFIETSEAEVQSTLVTAWIWECDITILHLGMGMV